MGENLEVQDKAVPPVNQRCEILAWGSFSALIVGLDFVPNLVDTVSSGATPFRAGEIASGLLVGGVAAYQTKLASEQTAAYKKASEQERTSIFALERKRTVQSMRTIAWASANFLLAEVAFIEFVKAAEAPSLSHAVGRGAVGAVASSFGVGLGIPRLKRSRRRSEAITKAITEATESKSAFDKSSE